MSWGSGDCWSWQDEASFPRCVRPLSRLLAGAVRKAARFGTARERPTRYRVIELAWPCGTSRHGSTRAAGVHLPALRRGARRGTLRCAGPAGRGRHAPPARRGEDRLHPRHAYVPRPAAPPGVHPRGPCRCRRRVDYALRLGRRMCHAKGLAGLSVRRSTAIASRASGPARSSPASRARTARLGCLTRACIRSA